MFHWESPKIEGFFEKVRECWYIFVDCEKYGIFPEMLPGRLITVKGNLRRLGDYVPGGKLSKCYFYLWPENVGAYIPPPPLAYGCKRLYTLAATGDIKKEVFRLRCMIKEDAVREMRRRMVVPPWPSVVAWSRWALEYLDGVLVSLAAADLAPLPPNQFQYLTVPDLQSLSAQLFSRF